MAIEAQIHHLGTEQATDIRLLIEQFIIHCYANNQAESTIRTRRTHLKQFACFCEQKCTGIFQVSNMLMDAYFLEYSRGFPEYTKPRSSGTTNTSRRILKVFFRWVEEYKELTIRVRPGAIRYPREPKKLPKALDRKVILKAISVANQQDSLLINLNWRAGLRISELVAIKEKDIKNDEIHIYGKGANERVVYVTDSLAKQLEAVKSGDPNRHIFRNIHGEDRDMGVKAARLHIQRVFSSIGVKMYPHQLRHSFAIDLLTQGCDLISIQTMMGHEDITTTQVYLRLLDSQVKSQYKKFMV